MSHSHGASSKARKACSSRNSASRAGRSGRGWMFRSSPDNALLTRGDSLQMKNRFQPPDVCPQCGEDVPRNAKACPECGADEQTGWKEDAYASDGVELPD